jgi:hypothetical protein
MSTSDNIASTENQQDAAKSKYSRRRRVYEKLKAKREPLSTVPEDSELQAIEQRRLKAMQVIFAVAGIFMLVSGVRTTLAGIRELMHTGLSESSDTDIDRIGWGASHLYKNGSRGNSHLLRRKDENEDLPSEDADELHAGPLPAELRFLVDVNEPILKYDRPLFWAVPRAGSATVKNILTQCFGLLSATETGADSVAEYLTVVSDLEGGQYINVDTTTPTGIEHAAQLQVGNLPNLQLVATPFLYEASEKLFSEYYRARMFTLLRHPVERAASLFYRMAQDKKGIFSGMTLEDYANSPFVENNWMTRFLNNGFGGELSLAHVTIATEILRRKCLVGLLKHKTESFRRFEDYFHLTIRDEKVDECHTKMLDWNWPNKNKHTPVREGSEAWRLLMKHNAFDVKLYQYAEEIFEEQESLFDR